jgi:F420-non-reducing hydrogenase large subunit
MRRISIDPITRLEGHGRIDIFLDDFGDVDECYLVIPEIRGFEKFVEGRPIEELPRITSRICGVCPEAHHAASAKAVDAAYAVEIPEAAEIIRRLPEITRPISSRLADRTSSSGRSPRPPNGISSA